MEIFNFKKYSTRSKIFSSLTSPFRMSSTSTQLPSHSLDAPINTNEPMTATVFWDYENIGIPVDFSALKVMKCFKRFSSQNNLKIIAIHLVGNHRIVTEDDLFISQMRSFGVSIHPVISSKPEVFFYLVIPSKC